MDTYHPLPIAPRMDSGEDRYNMSDIDVKSDMGEVNSRKQANRSLIDSAFPSQGTTQPAHMGSQSSAPSKMSNQYSDTQ